MNADFYVVATQSSKKMLINNMLKIKFDSFSVYSMRQNQYRGMNGGDLKRLNYLALAGILLNEQGLSEYYLVGSSVTIKDEIYYKSPQGEKVHKVTITAKGEITRDSSISGYYQPICETIFFIGSRDAWNTYHSVSVASREKDYSVFGLLSNIYEVLFSLLSVFNPTATFFAAIGAINAVVSGGIGSLDWFQNASISKFDKFILDRLLKTNEDPMMFLFSVIDRTIEYANQKRRIIYRAY